ncbi:hypothetical protein JB92DRAFT_3146913 [Gautieria morchelliformis]|nr:hypothetical protein JB92DRAFT_3146913 [Gautieria morchelliformis]
MYSRPAVSPLCSTPSLRTDRLYSSSPDDFLSTPSVAEWKEVQRLVYAKADQPAADPHTVSSSPRSAALHTDASLLPFQLHLPSKASARDRAALDAALSAISDPLPPYPHTTVSPQEVFPDYAEVCRYLEKKARASSPVSECYISETDEAPPTPPPAPVRSVGKKAKRDDDDCDDDKPAVKRHMVRRIPSPDVPTPPPARVRSVGKKAKRDDDDWDQDKPTVKRQMLRHHTSPDTDSDQDDSGNFQPSRRPAAKRRAPASSSSRHPPKAPRRPASPKPPKPSPSRRGNRGKDYPKCPHARRVEGCPDCQRSCWYSFVYGDRKGEECRRLFQSGRESDLGRHKASHARQEWQWLEEGVISRKEADWHFNVFGGKERGYICPNGKCPTTFTRYDALKRHMDNGTCKWPLLDPGWDRLDKQQRKDKIKEASNNKYDALVAERDAVADL